MTIDYNNNAIKTLLKMGVDVDKLHKKIEIKLIKEKDDFVEVKINSKDIPLDDITENILKGAEKECDLLNDNYLDTQHILLASIKVKSEMSSIFKSMKVSYRNCKSNVVSSIEPAETDGDKSNKNKKSKIRTTSKNTETPILDNFSIDVTKRATEGKIDPVIGRADFSEKEKE
jgi:ATP-dependent Clp protease ATP-binding subunit ClpA